MLTDRISTLPLTAPVTVEAGTPVGRVVDEVQAKRVGCVLVYETGRMVGIITERDMLLKVVARDVDYATTKIDDFMTARPRNAFAGRHDRRCRSADDRTQLPPHPHHRPRRTGHGHRQHQGHHRSVAESLPEQVLNLPPRPHQRWRRPRGVRGLEGHMRWRRTDERQRARLST